MLGWNLFERFRRDSELRQLSTNVPPHPLPPPSPPPAASVALNRVLREQQALRAVIESISAEVELRPLLTRIVCHACELLEAEEGAIGLYDAERFCVRIEAVHAMPVEELGAEFAAGDGLTGHVLATRRPVVAEAYRQLPRPLRADRADHAVLGVPIEWRGQLIGVFGLGALPPRRFNEQDVEALTLFARYAAIAIDNAQRYLQEREHGLRGQHLAALEERHRIARELHDSVSQQIFSISLQAQAVAAAWRRDPAEGERVVDSLVRSCRAAQVEMRALLQELRPPGERSVEETTRELSLPPLLRVRRQGLPAALGQYLDQVATEGVDVTVDAMAYRPQQPEVEEALFRIAQEALHNVFKHARAHRARVRLVAGSGVILEVSDDGIGLGGSVRGSGLGLLSMRERAKAQGGTFELQSRPGEGTTVRVTLPAPPGHHETFS